MERYDSVIIGSGPAGLAAAINLKIRGRKFLLFGTKRLSRKLEAAPKIENYLGLYGISGKALAEKFARHLAEMEIEIICEQISTVYPMGDYFAVATGTGMYETKSVILAMGAFSAKELPGESEFLGRGVGYCATCDAPLFRGKTVAVLGYSPEAVNEANFVSTLAAKVYYIPLSKTDNLLNTEIEVVTGKVKGISGTKKAEMLEFEDKTLKADGFFILRDTIAPTALLPGIETESGFIKTDVNMCTNIPGCFAAGDCTGKPHQYMRAAGQGQTAALNADRYIDELKQS